MLTGCCRAKQAYRNEKVTHPLCVLANRRSL